MKTTVKPSESILVLDLDDTLYAEHDYKLSGIHAVCREISSLYPEYREKDLISRINTDSSTWLEELCTICEFNESEKQSLLWLYRTHKPNLNGFMPSEKLKCILKQFTACVLLSDGRSLTQRQKLKALNLLDYFDDILISEAYRSEKPDSKRFLQVQQTYPGKNYIYIGDNIKKDFITPNRLGWLTIGIRPTSKNIHRHRADDFDEAHQPCVWIESINELPTLFLSE
ncbi:HAD family hydrolase [Neisseria zalophi]|uniref:HAD family hydrolase n=1 Tax=Neisseria zalophi TaxID=640030 RepID=A0A5J6PR72_9NEIS|nr:HAD family hydrolase [Neisseria zalophi]QEY25161.1 HAD family hydrolase [Neisseria zalophi]